jgi:ribonuclease Z
MSILHLLGTGASLSGPGRTTTMLALEGRKSIVLIDCGGDAGERLLSAGLELDRLSAVVLTHEHPDHVCGFPLLIQKLWLAKRRRPIPIRGPARALDQARRLFETFNTAGWEGLPSLEWHPVEPRERAFVWSDADWTITAAPGTHGRTPSIGIRAEEMPGGTAVAYSSDTEESPAIARMAHAAAILVHEATGAFKGHSEFEAAARVAALAEARRLVLVHLPPNASTSDLGPARAIFPRIQLGNDGDSFAL